MSAPISGVPTHGDATAAIAVDHPRTRRSSPPGARVLDLACGRGRHARWFAARGAACWRSIATPTRSPALAGVAGRRDAPPSTSRAGAWPLAAANASTRSSSPTTCIGRCFAHLLAALADDGVLLYETFARGNEAYGRPSNPAFLLEPGRAAASRRGSPRGRRLRRRPRRGAGRDAVVQRIAAVGPAPRVAAGAPVRPSVRTEPARAPARSNAVKSPLFRGILHVDRQHRRDRDADAGRRSARPSRARQADRFSRRERHRRDRHRRHDRRIADRRRRRALPADRSRRRIRARTRSRSSRAPAPIRRREAIALTAYAKKAGVASCLSVVPYYNKPTQEGLYRHFRTIAETVDAAADPLQRAGPHGRRSRERDGAAARAGARYRRPQGRDGRPRPRQRAPARARAAGKRDFAVYSGDDIDGIAADADGRARRDLGHRQRRAEADGGDVRGGARGRPRPRPRMQRPPAAAASPPLRRSQSDSR